jgi:AraC-like DNA-binding protein
MAAPAYREYAPRAALADFVHCVWTFSAEADDAPQPIAPDGRCELIVQRGAPYREVESGTVQPLAVFAGQVTQPLILVATGAVDVVGVRFRPEAARAFLGRAADKATDRRIDLSELHGEEAAWLIAHVRAAKSAREAADAAESYVERRVNGAALDRHVCAAVAALLANEDVAAPADVSERQFQRRFKAEVGVSVRELQSVLRFRRVFDAIDAPGPPGWIEAALTAGYFDQPQMARDFRRYLGVSSRQWVAQRAGLATVLAQAPESYKKRPPR